MYKQGAWGGRETRERKIQFPLNKVVLVSSKWDIDRTRTIKLDP